MSYGRTNRTLLILEAAEEKTANPRELYEEEKKTRDKCIDSISYFDFPFMCKPDSLLKKRDDTGGIINPTDA